MEDGGAAAAKGCACMCVLACCVSWCWGVVASWLVRPLKEVVHHSVVLGTACNSYGSWDRAGVCPSCKSLICSWLWLRLRPCSRCQNNRHVGISWFLRVMFQVGPAAPAPAPGDLEGSGARQSFPAPREGHPSNPWFRPHWRSAGGERTPD